MNNYSDMSNSEIDYLVAIEQGWEDVSQSGTKETGATLFYDKKIGRYIGYYTPTKNCLSGWELIYTHDIHITWPEGNHKGVCEKYFEHENPIQIEFEVKEDVFRAASIVFLILMNNYKGVE